MKRAATRDNIYVSHDPARTKPNITSTIPPINASIGIIASSALFTHFTPSGSVIQTKIPSPASNGITRHNRGFFATFCLRAAPSGDVCTWRIPHQFAARLSTSVRPTINAYCPQPTTMSCDIKRISSNLYCCKRGNVARYANEPTTTPASVAINDSNKRIFVTWRRVPPISRIAA